MSDGVDWTSMTAGTVIGLGAAFIKGLFTRNISAHDQELLNLKAEIAVLRAEAKVRDEETRAEFRSQRDELARQRADNLVMVEKLATATQAGKAAHDRIDALIAPSPVRDAR